MASSFIKYKDKGFWINDRMTEIICALFYINLKQKTSTKEQWLTDFQELMLNNATGSYNSHMHFDFDESLINTERISEMAELINETAEFLMSSSQLIDLTFIEKELLPEEHSEKGNWAVKIGGGRLLKILFYLELLLNEKLLIRAEDPVFYSF